MMCNNSDVDKSRNKVYINPNFNRPPVNNYLMHVNPKFPHLLSSIPLNSSNKTRIHINPNFMKAKSVDVVVKVDRPSINITDVHSHEQLQPETQMLSVPVAKSRYCLVRQNTSIVTEGHMLEKPKTTVQINKYKSVPLNDIKRKLDNAKNGTSKMSSTVPLQSQLQNQLQSTKKNDSVSSTTDIRRNKFKVVNNKAQHVRNVKTKTRTSIDKQKKVLSNQLRLNKIKGNLKKNNIPCPMFRKFGKCLRKEHGNCDFLHDKKHVSICRKFIKGLCHDRDCLLSHDLTMKKMPTCYFYLKGTCTKPDCPYLHVKLNEKVKVCPDFLKGYCERGHKCLQRHSDMQSRQKVKDSLVTRPTASQKNSKLKAKTLVSINTSTKNIKERQITEKNKNNLDRYYQDNKDSANATEEVCEVIKPTRCKLGSLPSFIQF